MANPPEVRISSSKSEIFKRRHHFEHLEFGKIGDRRGPAWFLLKSHNGALLKSILHVTPLPVSRLQRKNEVGNLSNRH
jgi:hypothetical protein